LSDKQIKRKHKRTGQRASRKKKKKKKREKKKKEKKKKKKTKKKKKKTPKRLRVKNKHPGVGGSCRECPRRGGVSGGLKTGLAQSGFTVNKDEKPR